MTADVLDLEQTFNVFDLAEKARDAAAAFAGGDVVPAEEQEVLRALNKGLKDVVGGHLAVAEPASARGEEAVEAWAAFAVDVAFAFECLTNEGCTVFYAEGIVADKLAESGEASTLPEYLKGAVNWKKVAENLSHTFVEMVIDGKTYVSNVGLD